MEEQGNNKELTTDQQIALDFLRENVDFFAAPFISPYPFKLWSKQQNSFDYYNTQLLKALDIDEKLYINNLERLQSKLGYRGQPYR